ncbi:MAG TPA: hypothetical protein VIV60_34480, partial [Polyangiaceae bacterium]
MTAMSDDREMREEERASHRERRVITLPFPPPLWERLASDVDVQPFQQDDILPSAAAAATDEPATFFRERITTHNLSLMPEGRRNSMPTAVPIRLPNTRPAPLVSGARVMVDLNGTKVRLHARRKWPAILAFTVAGLLVALIAIGVLLRQRDPGMVVSSSEPS